MLLIFAGIGLITGFFSGFFGIGGGSIRIPLLSFAGMPLISAFAINMFAIPFSSLIGAYVQRKNITWKVVKAFTLGATIGIIIATFLVYLVPTFILALIFFFAAVLTILGLYLNKISPKIYDLLEPTKINLFIGAFEHLRDCRNKLIHGREEEVNKDDEKMLRDTIQKIENCIDSNSEEDEEES